MHNDDRNVAGLMLFMLGGLAGTALALRWSRRGDETLGSRMQGLHAALDETVQTVESSVSYLRRVAAPFHELLEEASALAGGVQRTLDSYRQIGSSGRTPEPAGYVPSMAPESHRSGAGPS